MARAVWSGSISFGLVNVPVKAYTAVRDHEVRFHQIDNDQLIAYSKKEGDNEILVVVNLDARNPQSGFISFPPCEVHDLLSGGHWVWGSERSYVELSPHTLPAHVFKVTRR